MRGERTGGPWSSVVGCWEHCQIMETRHLTLYTLAPQFPPIPLSYAHVPSPLPPYFHFSASVTYFPSLKTWNHAVWCFLLLPGSPHPPVLASTRPPFRFTTSYHVRRCRCPLIISLIILLFPQTSPSIAFLVILYFICRTDKIVSR